MKYIVILALAIAGLLGCSDETVTQPLPQTRLISVPVSEVRPPAEVPVNERHSNIGNPRMGWGSCYHAAACDGLIWLGRKDIADRWYKEHQGGSNWQAICKIARGYGINCKCSGNGDETLLQEASDTRRGAAISFAPLNTNGQPIHGNSLHAVWFCGYVGDYAFIIDNNFNRQYHHYHKAEFLSIWKRYGGMAVEFLIDAPELHDVIPSDWLK
jgi:hypothetical protein